MKTALKSLSLWGMSEHCGQRQCHSTGSLMVQKNVFTLNLRTTAQTPEGIEKDRRRVELMNTIIRVSEANGFTANELAEVALMSIAALEGRRGRMGPDRALSMRGAMIATRLGTSYQASCEIRANKAKSGGQGGSESDAP